MFDFGFSEILLIAVVALVVLGPQRLPTVARAAGHWLGRLQHFVADVKTELSAQSGMAEFSAAKDGLESAARQLQQELNHSIDSMDASLREPDSRSAWERLPAQRTPADFNVTATPAHWPVTSSAHTVSLRRQALQRRRDLRPRHRIRPQLRVRRHSLPE